MSSLNPAKEVASVLPKDSWESETLSGRKPVHVATLEEARLELQKLTNDLKARLEQVSRRERKLYEEELAIVRSKRRLELRKEELLAAESQIRNDRDILKDRESVFKEFEQIERIKTDSLEDEYESHYALHKSEKKHLQAKLEREKNRNIGLVRLNKQKDRTIEEQQLEVERLKQKLMQKSKIEAQLRSENELTKRRLRLQQEKNDRVTKSYSDRSFKSRQTSPQYPLTSSGKPLKQKQIVGRYSKPNSLVEVEYALALGSLANCLGLSLNDHTGTPGQKNERLSLGRAIHDYKTVIPAICNALEVSPVTESPTKTSTILVCALFFTKRLVSNRPKDSASVQVETISGMNLCLKLQRRLLKVLSLLSLTGDMATKIDQDGVDKQKISNSGICKLGQPLINLRTIVCMLILQAHVLSPMEPMKMVPSLKELSEISCNREIVVEYLGIDCILDILLHAGNPTWRTSFKYSVRLLMYLVQQGRHYHSFQNRILTNSKFVVVVFEILDLMLEALKPTSNDASETTKHYRTMVIECSSVCVVIIERGCHSEELRKSLKAFQAKDIANKLAKCISHIARVKSSTMYREHESDLAFFIRNAEEVTQAFSESLAPSAKSE